MIDNRAEVYSILKNVDTSVEVEFRYPSNLLDQNYPKICYFMSNSMDREYQDNEAKANLFETTVQVYEKPVNGYLKEIHLDVDYDMRKNGYKRVYYDSYYDTEDRVYIYTLRYTKLIIY